MMSADPTPIIPALRIEPTYSARSPAWEELLLA
jgi:hypothetical protein